MFYIRADANTKLGSGHVMRCLAIAKAIRMRGEEVTFITADHAFEELIKEQNISLICLESVWSSLEDELPKLKKLISEENIQAILIDSYYVTNQYFEELRKTVKVFYLDDLYESIYSADTVINYNIYANELPYANQYPAETKLLLGCRYVPLRDEFIGHKRAHSEKLENVLITTGGADTYNVAGQLLNFLRNKHEFDNLTLHVIVGPLNTNFTMLEELAKQYSGVMLYQNISDMADLMLRSDVAISAGGSTLYELCSCGVPTISFSYADNQWQGVKEFDRQGIIYYAGDIRENVSNCFYNIAERLNELCSNREQRDELSRKMQEVVDGFGACRIAEELLII